MKELILSAFQNQFLTGGFVLMVTGAIMALCRKLPLYLWNVIKRRITVSLDIVDSDPAFEWLTAWLDEHPYTKRARTLSVSTQLSGEDGNESTLDSRVLFSPAPGSHFFIHNRRFIWLSRQRGEPNTPMAAPAAGRQLRRVESFRIDILARRQDAARELIAEAMTCARRTQQSQSNVYMAMYGWWKRLRGIELRPLDSVILPDGQGEYLLADMATFLSSRSRYLHRSIPYRRGYLFYGVAGSGKTSLTAALARELKLNLCLLNLAAPHMNDERLFELVLELKPRSILLLEDVDVAMQTRESKHKISQSSPTADTSSDEQRGVSLSGLLNCLDGIATKDGLIVVMTTNHREKLDPALIRPGRVDVDIEFRYADSAQVHRMYRRFYPEGSQELEKLIVHTHANQATMAEVQQWLMKCPVEQLVEQN